jgi:hypothetical protein
VQAMVIRLRAWKPPASVFPTGGCLLDEVGSA